MKVSTANKASNDMVIIMMAVVPMVILSAEDMTDAVRTLSVVEG